LQPLGRCPRCGYPLTYDGRGYRCEFCGYPRNRQTLTASIRNLERNLRFKAQSLLDSGRRDQYQRMTFQYPYSARQQVCSSCRLRIPNGVQTCPYCGAPQRTAQPSSETVVNPIPPQAGDQQVLDYIAAHNGTISISRAATELSVSPENLRTTIERLKSAGFLKPT
jgi:predicted amidophosphoribosyltransferase